jgi:alpha-mannosidase
MSGFTPPQMTLEKLKGRIPAIIAAATREEQQINPVWTMYGPPLHMPMAAPPPTDDANWRILAIGERWGAPPGSDPSSPPRKLGWDIPADGGHNHWLRARFSVPEMWRGQPVLLAMDWEGRGQGSMEAILYIDGQTVAGIDEFHKTVLLPSELHKNHEAEALIRLYIPHPKTFTGLRLVLRDEPTWELGHLMLTLLGVAQTQRETDTARPALIEAVNTAYNQLDLRAGWNSPPFYASTCIALEGLRAVVSQFKGDDHRPQLIATGHAHLDIGWLWPVWRSHQKVAHTVATALHLMERYPDYHFSLSQPEVFQYLKDDDPALYARLKARVAEGRIEPVGAMWVEADCNVTSGESLVRQITHGLKFFQAEFGKMPNTVWLPDVFGYSAALPQIMRKAGIASFMTTKISWSQFNRMPVDTFRWRGIDGSDVLAHFVTVSARPMTHPADPHTYTYNGDMTPEQIFGTWAHYRQKPINDELLYIFGHGDGGGGPTEEMLYTAQILKGLPDFPVMRHGRVDSFFEQLYRRVWQDPRLPTWVGELYMEYHRGTYTSQARTKQANRAAELQYREAEWLNAWAASVKREPGDAAPDQPYVGQQAQLDAGWKLILLNQFHDILPGSSVPLVYVESDARYAQARQISTEVRDAALGHITSQIKAGYPGLAVFNALPWARRDVLEYELQPGVLPAYTDAEGEKPLIQIALDDGKRSLLVEVDVPSYGYSVLSERGSQKAFSGVTAEASALAATDDMLENAFLRLQLDENGEITSLFDKEHNREVVMPGARANQIVAYEDRPLNWDAWDIDLFYEEKAYPARDTVEMRAVESGPIRAVIEVTRKFGDSTIKQRICLWRAKRRVDFVTEVDWQARQMLLRALFPLNINAARATCEIQFGAAERPTHRNTSWDVARFEVCAHKWVDLGEGDYGVALLNDGKYGHSLHHNVIGLSLLKGAIHPDPEADRGLHRFTYSLYPHTGTWQAANVVREAYALNVPLQASPFQPNNGNMPLTSSFLRVEGDHVVAETVKTADDEDGLIVRLYEAHNQRGLIALHTHQPIVSAAETDLLEREIRAVQVADGVAKFEIRPFEVKTIRLRF